MSEREEADVPGRSPMEALHALFGVVYSGDTESVIDMYERAAWRAGAPSRHTSQTIQTARDLKMQFDSRR